MKSFVICPDENIPMYHVWKTILININKSTKFLASAYELYRVWQYQSWNLSTQAKKSFSHLVKSKSLERLQHAATSEIAIENEVRARNRRRLVALFVAFLSVPVGLADITSVFHSLPQNRRDRRSRRRSLLTSHDSRWLVRRRGERVVRPRLLRPLIYDPVGTRACKRIPRVKAGTLAVPTAILSRRHSLFSITRLFSIVCETDPFTSQVQARFVIVIPNLLLSRPILQTIFHLDNLNRDSRIFGKNFRE